MKGDRGDRRHRDPPCGRDLGDRRRGDPGAGRTRRLIGDPAVRHKGTIGGSLANNDPTADYPAACLALGATIVTNKRRLSRGVLPGPVHDLAGERRDHHKVFPLPKKAAYIKFRNQASRYALVGVFVAKRPGDVRVAVTGAGSDGGVPRHLVRGGPEEALLGEGARRADGAGRGAETATCMAAPNTAPI